MISKYHTLAWQPARRLVVALLLIVGLCGLTGGVYLLNSANATNIPHIELGIRILGLESNPQMLLDFEASLGNGVYFRYPKRYLDWPDALPITMMDQFNEMGRTSEITWQPWTNGVGIPYDDILGGNYDEYIRSFAQSLKERPYHIWISFAAEMNGNWSTWGIDLPENGHQKHIDMWRYVVNKVRAEGVTNVSWIWTPNVRGSSAPAAYSSFYPGDSYVDYLGLDGYNWGGQNWTSFRATFQSSYDEMAALSSLPIVIMETGTVEGGGDKAQWIRDMGAAIPIYFPRLYSVTWFNRNTGGYDWRIETSKASMQAFADVFGNAAATPTPTASSTITPSPTPAPESTPITVVGTTIPSVTASATRKPSTPLPSAKNPVESVGSDLIAVEDQVIEQERVQAPANIPDGVSGAFDPLEVPVSNAINFTGLLLLSLGGISLLLWLGIVARLLKK